MKKIKNYPHDQETVVTLAKKGMKPNEIDDYLKKQFTEMQVQAVEFMEMLKKDNCPHCGKYLNGDKK